MDNQIQLISDGDGLVVIGSRADVERFLAAEGLWSLSKDFELPGLGPFLRIGSAVAQAGSDIAAHSSRWLKLTEESAQRVKEFGLMESKTPGISHAMVGEPGSIKSWLQVAKGSGAFLTNPAVLSGAAGIMAQLARQHEMNEIQRYLATIDQKVDDVLRAQEYSELGKVLGADFDVECAMTVREQTGRIDEITWSTVQGRINTITDALGWTLLRLNALTEMVESKTKKIGDLAKAVEKAESEARKLLIVLAHCFELQDALDVLRLDRVLDAYPNELDGHRLALNADRHKRRERIARETGHLMARMDAAAATADSHVLLHSTMVRAVVGSINRVGIAVDDFHRPLGIECGRHPMEATRWRDAARDPGQLKNAAAEVGRSPLVKVGAAGLSLGAVVLARNAKKMG
ncbi:hypothetical protein [Streptomyces sp. NPDC020951]|uniref:hypothetical protein n=1 Tax=Streptomyces sp. NPDC020951 TaxID=3365104 RepID=UPI00378B9973